LWSGAGNSVAAGTAWTSSSSDPEEDIISAWNKVLTDLGLEPIKGQTPGVQPPVRRYGSGGESPEHRALKEYVCVNPQLVGADAECESFTEYSFPSLDAVDVIFKTPSSWVAVEVKSRISDQIEQDYERGLYQCVKYHALLDAMRKDMRYPVPSLVRVVLLLETQLPRKFRNTAEALGIEVIEGISVPEGYHE